MFPLAIYDFKVLNMPVVEKLKPIQKTWLLCEGQQMVTAVVTKTNIQSHRSQ